MFTGIIQALGSVKEVKIKNKEMTLTITLPKVFKNVKNGNSIAVNGVCLTVTKKIKNNVTFFCQRETIEITNLKNLKKGSQANLERAMTLNDELGGHMVQGHVDLIGTCKKIETIGEGWRYWVGFSKRPNGLVLKGSVALDGISLTISRLHATKMAVDIIPFTYENTNIQLWEVGTQVNIETDVIGKYVESYMRAIKK